MSGARVEQRTLENRRTLTKLSVVAAAMFGFGFALAPFYDRICQALGINNFITADTAPVNAQVDRTRSLTIELDANTHDLAWRFRPLVGHLTVHPGELVHVEYEITNVRQEPVTAQAVPSFGPQRAGQYFRKLDCFCFTQQTLAGGETRRMPVVFLIDPALPRDVSTITLSYTFFEVPGKKAKS